MRQAEGAKPNGIRTIFASAMGQEDVSRQARFRFDRIDGNLVRHVVGGALCGLALVAVGTFAVTGRAAAPLPGFETTPDLYARSAAVKADRETVHRVASAHAAFAAVTVAPASDDPLLTVVTPRLAYATDDPRSDASIAIDTILERPPILVAALADPGLGGRSLGGLPQASIADEEDDDEAEPIPMPRPRPAVAPTTPLVMPLPKARPPVLMASLRPSTTPDDPIEPPPAPAPRPGPALGFFSSPSDPVPNGKMRLDTPFGVPYEVQTSSVETACLKPQLVEILRKVEGHYHRKVVITSGFRDRGRQGSLHRQCAAVDVEIPGVDAATFASWVRTMPEVGGVGTYCHPRMIHIDIGAPRDWKYGCGSFFAMRGGAPGRWGKVPGALAKLAGSPKPAAQAIGEDEESSTE